MVVPGENVEVKFAGAYVVPLGINIDESTVPIFVREDERLIVVSCNDLAGFQVESCNCTKMQLYVLLSARTLAGPINIFKVAGPVTAAKEVF